MVKDLIKESKFNTLFELRKSIYSVCDWLEQQTNSLDEEEYQKSIDEIECSIKLLTDTKSILTDYQTNIDYEINGNSSVEIYIDYDYEFEREDDERVFYSYSHPNGSNIISFSKEVINETISDGGDLDSLITNEINDEIRNQY